MKTSSLILELIDLMNKHGDVDVVMVADSQLFEPYSSFIGNKHSTTEYSKGFNNVVYLGLGKPHVG